MDTVSTSALVALLIILIFLSAFFSASEISMMAINRYRLKHMADSGNRAAIVVSRLLERPDRLLGIILIGNNLVNFMASAVAAIIAARLYGEAGIAASVIPLTVVVLIFAEVAPKTLAASRPERMAFPAAYILNLLLKLLYPVVWSINLIANQMLKLLGVKPGAGTAQLSGEELRAAVLEAGGLIPESHQTMLLAILDLEKMTVEDVMVPRGRITGIDLEADWDSISEQISGSRFTRLPVYRGTLDKVVGMVHLRKLIGPLKAGRLDKEAIEQIMVDPYFIPEGTPLTTQLLNFRKARRRRGLVVDEYGDILGLVTLEEILEEIVGDFTTETLGSTNLAQEQDDGSYVIAGSASIRDINRQLDWELPIGDSRTLNGLITEFLEDLPAPGTSLLIGDYLVEILQTRGPVIQVARLRHRTENPQPSETGADN